MVYATTLLFKCTLVITDSYPQMSKTHTWDERCTAPLLSTLLSIPDRFRPTRPILSQSLRSSPSEPSSAHPLASVPLPQETNPQTRFVLMVGLMDKDRPVHASRARRWATIQSTEPLRFTTAKEVVGERTEMSALTGLADET